MTWGMLEKVFLRGTITALTGIRIGGSEQGLSASGLDGIVARHALLDEPYLPGSSIRGRMRCALERLHGITGEGPSDDRAHPIVQLFGAADRLGSASAGAAHRGAAIPSRVLVRDALLTADARRRMTRLRGVLPLTEIKAEVSIDRVTSAASPRTFERVPAGATFTFELVLEVRAGPTEVSDVGRDSASAGPSPRTEANGWARDDDLRWLLIGLSLIQDDALGGGASRGQGRVKIRLDPLTHRTRDDYLQGRPERSLEPLPEALAALIADLNARSERERAQIAEGAA